MHATHWGGPGEDYRLSKISSATIDSTDGVSAPAPAAPDSSGAAGAVRCGGCNSSSSLGRVRALRLTLTVFL